MPLQFACQNAHFDIVMLLLQHGVDPNVGRKNFMSPLQITLNYYKVGGESTKIVKALLYHGASCYSTGEETHSPLFLACHKGFVDVMTLFLASKQVDIDREFEVSELSQRTLLCVACEQSDFEMYKLLADNKASLTKRCDVDGYSPLLLAAKAGNLQIARHLLEQTDVDVDDDVNKKNGNRALHYGSFSNEPGVVDALLSRGADVTLTNSRGETALHMSTNLKVNELLIEAGADVGALDFAKDTPLVHQINHFDCVKNLVKHGAKVNIKSLYLKERTPLHLVSRFCTCGRVVLVCSCGIIIIIIIIIILVVVVVVVLLLSLLLSLLFCLLLIFVFLNYCGLCCYCGGGGGV